MWRGETLSHIQAEQGTGTAWGLPSGLEVLGICEVHLETRCGGFGIVDVILG